MSDWNKLNTRKAKACPIILLVVAEQNCNLKPSPESYNYVFAIATIRTSKHNPYKLVQYSINDEPVPSRYGECNRYSIPEKSLLRRGNRRFQSGLQIAHLRRATQKRLRKRMRHLGIEPGTSSSSGWRDRGPSARLKNFGLSLKCIPSSRIDRLHGYPAINAARICLVLIHGTSSCSCSRRRFPCPEIQINGHSHNVLQRTAGRQRTFTWSVNKACVTIDRLLESPEQKDRI